MSTNDTYDLMQYGIQISPELMTEEERIVDELSIVAHGLAIKYHNPYRWPLDRDEIFAELLAEISVAINSYYWYKGHEEFMLLSRTMLWNRMRELLARAYGKYRQHELTAYALAEEFDYNETSDEFTTMFIMAEFLAELTPLSQHIVRIILNPDDRMQKAIFNHIERRNTLYKKGAGVFGLPLKVIQEGINVQPRLVKRAYEEIKQKIGEEMSTLKVATDNKIDYANSLVSFLDVKVKDTPSRYERWWKENLIAQLKFRGIYQEGMNRRELFTTIREDDKKRGLPSDLDLPAFPPSLEGYLPKKKNDIKPTNGSKPEIITDAPKIDVSSDEDEDDEFDYKFAEKKNGVSKPVAIVAPKPPVETPAVIAPVVEENKIEKIEEKKPESVTASDPFLQLITLLRAGETLQIERVNDTTWNVRLIMKA